MNRDEDGVLCGLLITHKHIVQSVPAVAISIDLKDLGRKAKEVTRVDDPSFECCKVLHCSGENGEDDADDVLFSTPSVTRIIPSSSAVAIYVLSCLERCKKSIPFISSPPSIEEI